MNGALAELSALIQNLLAQGFIVFLRIGAAMSVLPALGAQSVPMRVKLGLALALTVAVAPMVAASLPPPDLARAGAARYLLGETVTGLTLGLGVRLLVLGLQTAGAIAAQATSLSQLLGGAGVEPTPAMGQILLVGGLALAMIAGYHLRLIALLVGSYDAVPAGALLAAGGLARWGIAQVSAAFALAFTLAAPFLVISVLYNLLLGVVNRAMPQLMVAFVGAPLITLGGLVLLFLFAPQMLALWGAALDQFLAAPGLATP